MVLLLISIAILWLDDKLKSLKICKIGYISWCTISFQAIYQSHNHYLFSNRTLYLHLVVILWTGCLTGWLTFLTRRQVDMRRWTDCKLFYFLFGFGRHYSSMLLVLMSIEKCFAVYFPLKSKTLCTVKTAKWATGIVGVILAAYNSVYFFIVKSAKGNGRYGCLWIGNFTVIERIVDSVLYSFGPFALMFITNFAIVFKFIRAKCNQSNATESPNQALAKSATRGTAMVVTVSVTFLILTAPTAVHLALPHVIQLQNNPRYRAFMNLTQYLNHSINGVLYCVVGSKFRMELVKILNRKRKRLNRSNVYSISNTSVTNTM